MQVTRTFVHTITTFQAIGICLLVMFAGCRPRLTSVSGTVTLDGKPLSISRDTQGTVIFEPDGGQGTVATGLLDSSGHFNLGVGGSFEIPTGKYYVAISISRMLPKTDQGENQNAEFLAPRKYASTTESGLRATVVSGENNFDFDLKSDAENSAPASGLPPGAGSQPESKRNALEKNAKKPAIESANSTNKTFKGPCDGFILQMSASNPVARHQPANRVCSCCSLLRLR
jgi:hypothetical protein